MIRSSLVAMAALFALAGCGTASAPSIASRSAATLRTAAAPAANPVLLVPGFLEPTLYFDPIANHLNSEGRQAFKLGLFPNVAPIEQSAAKLAQLVKEVQAKTGARHVDLVGHSAGGLIVRYYVKFLGGAANVDHLVTMSAPNHGTAPDAIGGWLPGDVGEFKPGCSFLNALNAGDETPGPIKYTALIGGLDELVLPHSSQALAGAVNVTIQGAMHGTVFLLPETRHQIDLALAR